MLVTCPTALLYDCFLNLQTLVLIVSRHSMLQVGGHVQFWSRLTKISFFNMLAVFPGWLLAQFIEEFV